MKKQRNIRNPEKWIGKHVRATMANWMDYMEEDDYFIDEWTGKLWRRQDEYIPFQGDIEEMGNLYDPCYSYSEEGILQMIAANKKAA